MTQALTVPRPIAALLGTGLLALAVLLCLQWPLRDWVQAHNRSANDWGQIVFAWFMACAISVASWRGTHLRAHATGGAWLSAAWPRAYGLLACVLPWAALLLWTSLKPMSYALVNLERFPETLTAGYWLIHLAVTVLAGAAGISAIAIARRSLNTTTAGAPRDQSQ
jgi:TRAP-type C4-dicarboxylate transport system permease small subunit